MWYQIPYLVLVVYGFLASGWFLETWVRGVHKVTLGVMDSGGWVLLILIALGMSLANTLVYGLPEPSSASRAVQNLFLYAVLDAVVTVRVIKWRRIRREEMLDRQKGGSGWDGT